MFKLLQLKNIPKGSRVSVVCLTKKGKRCKGKLKAKVVKKNASGKLRGAQEAPGAQVPTAGSRIDATITNPEVQDPVQEEKDAGHPQALQPEHRSQTAARRLPSKKRRTC